MNLKDILIEGDTIIEDSWSCSVKSFGKDGQVKVIGKVNTSSFQSHYIVRCSKCAQDDELFGEGYFKSSKYHLLEGKLPCGCPPNPRWTKDQYSIRCSRKALERNYTFIGFVGEWKGKDTKVKLSCEKHGEWSSGTIHSTLAGGGCDNCRAENSSRINTKPDSTMIESFFASGAFHHMTKFARIDRKDKHGNTPYWSVLCPECNNYGESFAGNLQAGNRPCACSPMRQQECYINWIVDSGGEVLAIKFGVANNTSKRVESQNRRCIYKVINYTVYSFPDIASCKRAERECKKELDCGILTKEEMPDGYTETTSVINLLSIIEIYKRNGGVICAIQ